MFSFLKRIFKKLMGLAAHSFHLTVNPDGTKDSSYPDGDKNPQVTALNWQSSPAVRDDVKTAGIEAIEVGTPFTFDVRAYLLGTENATAPITMEPYTGDDPTASGWTEPGSGDDIVHDAVAPGSGTFRLRATAGDASYAQTVFIPWACFTGSEPDPDDPATVIVNQGSSIQSAISAAVPGDIIELRSTSAGTTWTNTENITFDANGADGQKIVLRVRTGDTVKFHPTGGTRVWYLNNTSYWLIDGSKGQIYVGDQSLWSSSGGGSSSAYPYTTSMTMAGDTHHIEIKGASGQMVEFSGGNGYRGVSIGNDCHHIALRFVKGYGHGGLGATGASGDKDGLHLSCQNYIVEDCEFGAPFGGHNTLNIYGAKGVVRRTTLSMDWHTYIGGSSDRGDRAFACYPEGTNPAATIGSKSPWGPVLIEDCWIDGAAHDQIASYNMTPQCKTGMHRLIYRYNYEINNRGPHILETYLPGPVGTGQYNSAEYNRHYNNTRLNCYNWLYINYGNASAGNGTHKAHQDHRFWDNLLLNVDVKELEGFKTPTLVWSRNAQRADLQSYADKWLGATFKRNMIDSDNYRIELQVSGGGEGNGNVSSLTAANSTWPNVWASSNNTNTPYFADASANTRAGYALTSSSPGIDESAEKASVTANSSGTTVTVDDAYWIYDGFDLSYFNESGDYIAFYASDGETLKGIRQVASVNSKTSVTLTSSITIVSGDLVYPVLSDGTTVVRNIGANQTQAVSNPGHYIAMNLYGSLSSQIATAAAKPGVAGIQVRIPWSTMETAEDTYDFTEVQDALDLIAAEGKQMVLFIFDKSFDDDDRYVPTYMRASYEIPTAGNQGGGEGYISKRWDSYVTTRMLALVTALNSSFGSNANFEGIAFQESAISLSDADIITYGYTPELYRDELIDLLEGAATAMPNKNVFWYMNFIKNNQSYAQTIADAAVAAGVWVGGPDILEGSNSLETHVYPVLRNLADGTKFNSAQYDSFRHDLDPGPGYYHPQDVFEYARDSLRVSYIFWNNPLNPSPSGSYDIDDAYPVMEANPDFWNDFP